MNYHETQINQTRKQMKQETTPNVQLMSIEYLLLSIQAHPGKSQRWHLRRLYKYKHGVDGNASCGFFKSPAYKNVLWEDRAPQDVRYLGRISPSHHSFWSRMKSKSAEMHLTRTGHIRANIVRGLIKLKPCPVEGVWISCL